MNTQHYNMFCLPPAGSSASIYFSWKKIATQCLNIIPIEYAGHGIKMRHALIDQPELLARTITHEILAYSDRPFILFGHSVGGGLLWKVKDDLHRQGKLSLLKLMVISSRPEHQFIQHLRHPQQRSDEQIIKRLQHYNHFPNEILNNPDALHFFLKIIRNDFLISRSLS